MQFIIHIVVILSAVIYVFFVKDINHTEHNKNCGKVAYIFSILFSALIFIGRFAGISALLTSDPVKSVLNFYGDYSISRNIELLSWTTLFPVSVLFLGVIFIKEGKYGIILSGLCFTSALCCFIAFMCLFSSSFIFFLIGLTGWGALFIMIIIMYIIYRKKRKIISLRSKFRSMDPP